MIDALITTTFQDATKYAGQIYKFDTNLIGDTGVKIAIHISAKERYEVEFVDPILFKVSRTIEDEGAYVIGEIWAQPLSETSQAVLDGIQYGWITRNGNYAFPNEELCYVHIDGNIVVDIICRSICVTDLERNIVN